MNQILTYLVIFCGLFVFIGPLFAHLYFRFFLIDKQRKNFEKLKRSWGNPY